MFFLQTFRSYGTYFKGKAAGSQAHLATFSFHETKNFSAGEGGALVVNVPEFSASPITNKNKLPPTKIKVNNELLRIF